MRKRWISLYVENDVGVLAKVSGLFAGKNYNLESLTVGETEDSTVSRMTIGLNSDDGKASPDEYIYNHIHFVDLYLAFDPNIIILN